MTRSISSLATMACVAVLGLTLTACEDQPSDPQELRPVETTGEAGGAASTSQSEKTLPPVLLADVKKIIADAAANDQILVIDFWATWCIPCVEMFPQLHEELPKIGPNVKVVTITLDSPGKYEALAVDFLRKHDAMKDAYRIGGEEPQWNELIDGLGNQWQNMQVPAILVYNQDGELWDEFIDARAKPDIILARVKELAQQTSQSEQAMSQASRQQASQ